MSSQTISEGNPRGHEEDQLVPLAEAAERLRRSVWTLKRLYAAGELPVIVIRNRWFVPDSFIRQLFASTRPGHAGDLSQVAKAWFASHGEVG